MFDTFNRRIDYLRVSVTDRCDLRCVYCMPAEGVALKPHGEILSYEQIEHVAREAVALGVEKIRLTGGEPLVRRGIEDLVGKLAAIPGIRDLSMTTNGTRLSELAAVLRARGLQRVNVSLDTLDPRRYREITRGGDISKVQGGLLAAVAAGLQPIKVNMVILEDTTSEDVAAMQSFCDAGGFVLQKILRFSLYDRDDLDRRFHAERPPKCAVCNRLRLTADGCLKPCLFSEREVPVDFADVRGSFLRAARAKPASGSACANREMSQIGG